MWNVSSRPITLTLAAAVQALVTAAIAVGAGTVLVETLLGNAAAPGAAIPLTVLALLAAAATGYCAWGLLRLRNWARTPVVLTQIFVLVVAYYMFTSGQYAVTAAMAAVAAAGLALVLAPPTTATLFGDDPRGGGPGEGG
ncbi:hypothetical protein [Streptomonospora wellingtoniae]|uniref:Integral membrane protein n=1 Tax=Streptomonospora wellingtoniae TaxID=3075544 RepID=A0ABU2KQI9_9ACTN|nr:hypothetical protein [Streptomonospora sp. DSM 45055]MDT0301542.1 hypothetical protein [Streptomonospora sp. DSM 45055]